MCVCVCLQLSANTSCKKIKGWEENYNILLFDLHWGIHSFWCHLYEVNFKKSTCDPLLLPQSSDHRMIIEINIELGAAFSLAWGDVTLQRHDQEDPMEMEKDLEILIPFTPSI